ncbi:hypothetical protein WOLCODRAFT_20612 [Wolfiporia cocos MD-104 SS10]|uniref:Uncharacterized protein n=1 Tax=Wolfiporia cocos (strain MD-104) TaxID=742152 RepID=A0A2H3J2V2_WOLCO|nr:hypothetical protein WOLCODRAFT_20612 [Wolfiporia cocos MD-104 SS10]
METHPIPYVLDTPNPAVRSSSNGRDMLLVLFPSMPMNVSFIIAVPPFPPFQGNVFTVDAVLATEVAPPSAQPSSSISSHTIGTTTITPSNVSSGASASHQSTTAFVMPHDPEHNIAGSHMSDGKNRRHGKEADGIWPFYKLSDTRSCVYCLFVLYSFITQELCS